MIIINCENKELEHISPWIVEQIKKKEKKQEERQRLRIPLEKRPCKKKEKELESNRGITVIDIGDKCAIE